ncbi:hypothetical protein RQP46_005070 [Phenoliferia psychrophenolica]
MAEHHELTHASNYSAYVTINDAKVPVYKVVDKPDLRKTTCYIEAVTGAEFKVHYRDASSFSSTDWAAWVHIDGKSMRGSTFRKDGAFHSAPADDPRRVANWSGRSSGPGQEQPFMFSAPTLTDDVATAVNDENIIKNLATIQVKMHRGTSGKPVASHYTQATETVLHEKAKKAMVSHTAKLGAAKPCKPRSCTAFHYIDPTDAPYWTFEFRYLSRVLLELQGHVEAEPTPSPSASPPPAAAVKKEKHAASASAKGKGKRETITIDSDDSDVGDGDVEGEDSKAELKRLRERIAKIEGEDEGAGASGSAGGERKKVKREKVVVKEEKGKDGKVVYVLD